MNWTVFLYAAALKATAVLSLAFLVGLALRRQSASARYLLWTCALAAVLVVPLISLSLDRWTVRFSAVTVIIPSGAPVSVAPASPPIAALPAARPSISWLIAIWLCGVAAVLTRTIAGHIRVRRLLDKSEALLDPEWLRLLDDASARAGLGRTVDLRRSAETDIPLIYGAVRPVVLLPAGSSEWTPERRGVVLLHELVHARRLDGLWCAVARISCAVYWFHPLAWLAASRLRREQERSCDDAVVLAGTRQSSYADHLVGLARAVTVWPAALPMATTGDLDQRVRAVLDPARSRRALGRRTCLAALAAVAITIVPLAVLRAQSDAPMGALTVSVSDPSGAAVPHVLVRLKDLTGTFEAIAFADAAGECRFARLAAGHYDIEASGPGFGVYLKQGLKIDPGATVHLDIGLNVGQVAESVEVVGARPPRAASGVPKRIRVGGNVQATKLVHKVNPVYPPGAQAAEVEGTVLLRAVISTSGDLLGLSLVTTSVAPELAKAAMDAVSQWRYEPTLLNGVPVEVVTTITVNFRLE